jgi:hypothetical protein
MHFIVKLVFAFCVLVVITASLSFNISELVISQKYMNDDTNTCHNANTVKPALWLMWDGIIGFIEVTTISILVALVCLLETRKASERRARIQDRMSSTSPGSFGSIGSVPGMPSMSFGSVPGMPSMSDFRIDMSSDSMDDTFELIIKLCPVICVLVLSIVMQFIWVIIGAISLWHDNDPECGPKELHDTMWAMVIIHLVFIGCK